ncbi:DUF1302 family protein [Teredinibacter haidensis]|uniref:DUF1302 family protein n=1 Tax=Teredinibacter haidensis TaxID=2731755 RepID=UPI000948C28A|nr:DUF1302 family protein [Teredinibacter haidensis]
MNGVDQRWLTAIPLALFLLQAQAQDDFFSSVDVDLDASSEDKAVTSEVFSYRGYIQLIGKYGWQTPDQNLAFERDETGLDRVRSDAFVEFRGQLSESLNWQLSAKTELDWYQWQQGDARWQLHREQLRLKDAYLDATLENGVWLRAGNQVLAWGDSEGLSIIDILSPVDSREPGQAELQDLREAVPALMLSLPTGDSVVTAVLTYKADHNRYADKDQMFYPYIGLKESGLAIHHQQPKNQWEYALKWDLQLNGGDISVIAGDVNDNEFSLFEIDLEQMPATLMFEQNRVTVVGAGANRVIGSWLFRGELARYWGQAVEVHEQYAWQHQNQWRSMVGVEYSGVNDLTINYEINSIYAPEVLGIDTPAPAETEQWQIGHVFRIQHTALNERLTNQFWVLAMVADATQVFRWDMSYDLSDSWALAIAAIAYQNNSRSSTLYPFRKNDTLNGSVTFNF